VEDIESQRSCNCRINGEWNAGEVDQCCNDSCDEGGVAGVLFCRLDEAAEAIVFAADFLADAGEEELPEGSVVEGLGFAVAIAVNLVECRLEVLGLLEEIEGFGFCGGGLAELVEGGGGGKVAHGIVGIFREICLKGSDFDSGRF
jgi:hypothetical protein